MASRPFQLNKRGFKTKAEAEQWERDFLQQQQRNLDINFENFVNLLWGYGTPSA